MTSNVGSRAVIQKSVHVGYSTTSKSAVADRTPQSEYRKAIGMSEISDAIIVVVSEETGDISIAQGGEIRLNIDPVRLQQTLQRYLTINTRKRSKKEVAE